MPVTASAPGKLVLFGDHAAVYGHPCLVTAVDLRFRVTMNQDVEPFVTIDTPDLRANTETHRVPIDQLDAHNRRETAFVEAALKQVLDSHPIEGGLHIETEGPLITYGLGSSSAITVATIAALSTLLGLELSQRQIFDMAYAAVLDVQKTGSGVDLVAAVYGGTLFYVKGGEVIEPLALDHLPIIMGYSGAKVSTTNLITQVATLRAHHPQFIDFILTMLGEIAGTARDYMVSGNWDRLGELMDIHQGLLDSLGVNTPQLSHLIFAAREAGALGAKLSGAGGGDCMFALSQADTQTQIEQNIEQAGGTVVHIQPNAPGLRIGS